MDYIPADVYETSTGFEASKPKVSIRKLQNYANDSVAIKEEQKRADEFFESLPLLYEKTIKDEINGTEGEKMARLKTKAINRAFDELGKTEFTLLIITHTQDFNIAELMSLVKDSHIISPQIIEYAKEHNMELDYKRLN